MKRLIKPILPVRILDAINNYREMRCKLVLKIRVIGEVEGYG